MTPLSPQQISGDAWTIARSQHDVITHAQLCSLGYTREAIRHRLRTGRLFTLWPGVYAVGRPHVSRKGRWKAATLACGPESALDAESAAALWAVRSNEGKDIEVAVPGDRGRGLAGIRVRRVRGVAPHVTEVDGIPVLSLPAVLVELARRLSRGSLEAAVNEADKLDLMQVEQLREEIETLRGRPGVAALRALIDRATFRYSDSELERAFRPIIRRAGLPEPAMGRRVNGYKVDFYWPSLDFVIETDGGRFHRTAFHQTRDRRRDQAHTVANTAHLRFTHAQIRYERGYVENTIRPVAQRLMATIGD